MATTHGIDLSSHNGAINFPMVKASGKVDFAFLRAGYGKVATQKDKRFEEYYSGCKSVGIPVGAYWYSYVATNKQKTPYTIDDTIKEAEQEADACLACLAGKQYEYPIWYDIEEMETLALGITGLPKVIKAFCDKLEAAGYWVGVYMSADPMKNLLTDEIRNRYSCWVANVKVNKPSYPYRYDAWQHSWIGSISGINGDVDLDECYVDYPTLIKAKGKNGFTVVQHPPETPQVETKEVELTIDGESWIGTLRRK